MGCKTSSKPAWPWPHFSRKEMACHCDDCDLPVESIDFIRLMNLLEATRELVGSPMVVTSGYRCEDYDKRIGGLGEHTVAAVDIQCFGPHAHAVLAAAATAGFKRIGVSQASPDLSQRFIHLGASNQPAWWPSPWVWSY